MWPYLYPQRRVVSFLRIQSDAAIEISDPYYIYNPFYEPSYYGQYAGYQVICGPGSHRRLTRKPGLSNAHSHVENEAHSGAAFLHGLLSLNHE